MNSSVGLFGALEVAQRQYDLAWEVHDKILRKMGKNENCENLFLME